jgi:3-hydroxyacyl-CoA dehydrogenase
MLGSSQSLEPLALQGSLRKRRTHGHLSTPGPSMSSGPVTFERFGDVFVVTIDNPPVNALGVMRRDLVAAIEAAEGDAGATAAAR